MKKTLHKKGKVKQKHIVKHRPKMVVSHSSKKKIIANKSNKEPVVSKKLLKTYKINSGGIPVTVNIYNQPEEYVPIYTAQITLIGKTTGVILEKIREELINRVNLGIVDLTDTKRVNLVENIHLV